MTGRFLSMGWHAQQALGISLVLTRDLLENAEKMVVGVCSRRANGMFWSRTWLLRSFVFLDVEENWIDIGGFEGYENLLL